MNAKETKVQPFIEGTKQFLVPLFQRPYSWERKHWETLWDDLIELYEEEQPRNHFMGSVVTMPAVSVPEGVTKYVLIDGQQRLTTVLILLALIRDIAKSLPGSLADQIENLLLLNPYQEGNDRFKLLPTQADRDSFTKIVRGESVGQENQISNAYNFFNKKLCGLDELNLEKLRLIIVRHLLLVSIVLDADDNPHLIFESLNAKGRALTQADLIRNYFFMRMHEERQEALYAAYWSPLQERLGADLTECIRHFLMKDGAVVKQGEVFYTLKERADRKTEDEVIRYLKELVEFAGYYERFLHPDREPRAALRRSLERLHRLEVTTAYPFLLNVYHDFARKIIDERHLLDILDVLENFVLRRFICSIPTNTLNKVFPILYSQAMQHGSLLEGVKAVLAAKNYPRDSEFREKFVSARLYGGDRGVKGRLIIERLETSFGHHEIIDFTHLTIEHVMPQTVTDWWKKHLGMDWVDVHERWLNSIGNLTLSGYNPQLSNADYPAKRSILQNSHLELNNYFAEMDVWNEESIRKRADELASRALTVWEYFGPGKEDPNESSSSETEQGGPDEGYNITTVLSILGGGTLRQSESRHSSYVLNDGKIVIIKYSKLHNDQNNFWYGLKPNVIEDLKSEKVSHIVFVMGHFGLATIPMDTVEEYCSQTKSSYNPDGSIRHYHVLITYESIPHLYWSQETPRYSLEDCFKQISTAI